MHSSRILLCVVVSGILVAAAHAQLVHVAEPMCGAELVSPEVELPNPPQSRFENASVSADGRWVAFHSANPTLVPGDTNGRCDVFVLERATGDVERVSVGVTGQIFRIYVHDLVLGTTTCESRSTAGVPASASCYAPSALSTDGRFLAFRSDASNLVTGDTNGEPDVFVRDIAQQTTLRVSLAWNGAQANNESVGPQISADGRMVAFLSFATNMLPGGSPFPQPYVHDLAIGLTRPVVSALNCGPPNEASLYPALSADGETVVFESIASNLAPGDVNGAWDLYAASLRYVILAQHH